MFGLELVGLVMFGPKTWNGSRKALKSVELEIQIQHR